MSGVFREWRRPDMIDQFPSSPSSPDEWLRQFYRSLEGRILEAGRSLSASADFAQLRVATARAVLATFADSGIAPESVLELLAEAAVEEPGTLVWSDALNQRRFDLIDKEIQDELTTAERVELAKLTRLMRNELESETNTSLQKSRELHRRLLV